MQTEAQKSTLFCIFAKQISVFRLACHSRAKRGAATGNKPASFTQLEKFSILSKKLHAKYCFNFATVNPCIIYKFSAQSFLKPLPRRDYPPSACWVITQHRTVNARVITYRMSAHGIDCPAALRDYRQATEGGLNALLLSAHIGQH